MDELCCTGKLITDFIGLMATLRIEIMRSGTMANQVTVTATRIVCILTEAKLMEQGMTEVALTQKIPLLSASGQFRRE